MNFKENSQGESFLKAWFTLILNKISLEAHINRQSNFIFEAK